MPRFADVEMEDFSSRKKKVEQINLISAITHFFGNLNFGMIFGFFIKPAWQKLLEEKARYALYPAAGFVDIAYAVAEWYRAFQTEKTPDIVRATVYTYVGTVIPVAVAGLFFAPAIFAPVSPILFSLGLGGKAIFHLGTAAFYAIKKPDPTLPAERQEAKRLEYRNNVYSNLAAGTIGVLGTAAAATVFALALPYMFPIGIAGAALGGAYALYKGAPLLYRYMKEKISERREAQNSQYVPINDNAETNTVSRGNVFTWAKDKFSSLLSSTLKTSSSPTTLARNTLLNNASSTQSTHTILQRLPTQPIDITQQNDAKMLAGSLPNDFGNKKIKSTSFLSRSNDLPEAMNASEKLPLKGLGSSGKK